MKCRFHIKFYIIVFRIEQTQISKEELSLLKTAKQSFTNRVYNFGRHTYEFNILFPYVPKRN